MSANIVRKQLSDFFREVGQAHAKNVLGWIGQYLPFMKEYPEVVEQNISRFGLYFTDAPAHNHLFALKCLIHISEEVPAARPRIIKELGPVLHEYLPFWRDRPEMWDRITRLLEILQLPLSASDKYYRDLARTVVTLKQPLILIVGAGFSYDAMPITSELQPLLLSLLRQVDILSPTEMISENDEQVWKIAKEHQDRFKQMFAGWSAKMSPAPQHRIAARMLHDGQVTHLISLNWDDLIERAYFDQFGEKIPKVTEDGISPAEPSLWKLHGDVDTISSYWIFPYERGRVFGSLMESLKARTVNRRPQYALIVGYSEWEEEVRQRLIQWLQDNIATVIRIRPNWNTKDDRGIQETAKRFFQRLDIYFEIERKEHAEQKSSP